MVCHIWVNNSPPVVPASVAMVLTLTPPTRRFLLSARGLTARCHRPAVRRGGRALARRRCAGTPASRQVIARRNGRRLVSGL